MDQEQERPALSLVPEEPRGLRDELIDAGDGGQVAALRVELAGARRAEADAEGVLVAARQKHLDLQEGKSARWRVVEAAEQAKAAQRALAVATAHREAVQARTLRAEGAGTEASPSGRLLRFSSVEEFVVEYAWPVWEHRVLGKGAAARWCATWWAHTAACADFEELWESFEVARLEPPPSMAAWKRDFLWPFMRELTSEEGPFWRCTSTHHEEPEIIPATAAPRGFFQTYPSETAQLTERTSEGAGA